MSETPRFKKPSEVPVIPGTEGWERMYPYYYRFGIDKDREAYENSTLWYYDGLHYPEPMYPFDLIWDEGWYLGLSQFNTRIFMVPAAFGVDHRIVNGYIYISPVPVTDPKQVEERLQHFLQRAGYYYENWNDLYSLWKGKMEGLIKEIDSIKFTDLPDMEDISIVNEGIGRSSGYELVKKYNHLIDTALLVWQYHFEFLNLCYAAFVTFADFCRKAFSGIDDGTITRMVAGIDVILFQPDMQLRKLAKLAITLGVTGYFKNESTPDEIITALEKSEEGKIGLNSMSRPNTPGSTCLPEQGGIMIITVGLTALKFHSCLLKATFKRRKKEKVWIDLLKN